MTRLLLYLQKKKLDRLIATLDTRRLTPHEWRELYGLSCATYLYRKPWERTIL